MKPLRLYAVLLSTLIGFMLTAGLSAAETKKADIQHQSLARKALEKHIQPAYRRLTQAFEKLEHQTADLCNAAGAAKAEALRDAFVDAVKAWGQIVHIGFGPIRTDYRYERIWFWPDRKGIARRQVASALRSKPDGYDDPSTLAEKSIAVQGLGGFEDILYGEPAKMLSGENAPPPFLCSYIKAIASNLKTMAANVEMAWQDNGAFTKLWLNPGPENRSYLSDQETTFALLKAFIEGLERVRDVELARPLGVTERRRVLPGPFADSKLTMVFIAARISGLRSLFVDSGIANEMMRAAKANANSEAENAINQVLFEMKLVETRSKELAAIPDLLSDSAERSQAVALGFPLKNAHARVQLAAGRLTDLPVGFNASDGD